MHKIIVSLQLFVMVPPPPPPDVLNAAVLDRCRLRFVVFLLSGPFRFDHYLALIIQSSLSLTHTRTRNINICI